MKKQINLFIVLIIVFLCSSGFATIVGHLGIASATYVGGNITQDTLWSLVDSPFTVYNNVTVVSNATLTIEPGAEIRFGGPFSITVLGKLNADGAAKTITLTSNAGLPAKGDWKGIAFSSAQVSSLTNCLLEYATNGITANGGNVGIEHSTIKLCSQNGLLATNSQLTIDSCNVSDCQEDGMNITSSQFSVSNSVIMNNNGNGVSITGNGQISIQQNTILGNGNGILLAGASVSGVNISQNIISANTQNGIGIESQAQSNISIISNGISSNANGFYVSSPTSTTITNNSVSFNRVGFYYKAGSHTAKFNDIFSNTMGADIAADNLGSVDARQNYWGANSGPYQVFTNPLGGGNPVGGDGANIQFVFFLSAPIGHINNPPTAVLETDKSKILLNQEIMFFATNSFDDGYINWYKFDFGDNQTSGWTTLSVFAHTYSSLGTHQVKLTVMDDFGATDQTTSNISVQTSLSLLDVAVTVNSSDFTIKEGGSLAVTVFARDSVGGVGNATITLFSLNGGQFAERTGPTNSSGYLTTVYTASGIVRPPNLKIIATASKTTYADGSASLYLQVYPLLTVQILPKLNSIISESTTQITISVSNDGQPTGNANVTVQADSGTLSSGFGITNGTGTFSLNYTAPRTTTLITTTISATAEKTGFVNGASNTPLSIHPKILEILMHASPTSVYSGDIANLTVNVNYAGAPIEGAYVQFSTTSGNLTKTNGLTDPQGNLALQLQAPQVSNNTDVTIIANASSVGYADSQYQTTITASPRTFVISIKPELNSQLGSSEIPILVKVNCTQNSEPVEGANVTIFTTLGSFSSLDKTLSRTESTTDAQGVLDFTLFAPETAVSKVANITVIAAREGYVNGVNQTTVQIEPNASPASSGGFPLLTLLLIIVPVVIVVVVVVVLVKKKIIGFSSGEDGDLVE